MKISVDNVKKIGCFLFTSYGLTAPDAKIASDCLVEAELAGISSHGVSMIPAHIRKLKKGYDLCAKFDIEKSTAVFSVCNAHNSIGMVSAWKCTELAVNKASESGMHMVLCHNANTFSAAYCYAKYMVDNKKIGIVTCNSPAQMAPTNGVEKLLGTNPLAIGIPADSEDPFILDMATSVVAKSKINQALHAGEKIPYGWATDIDGNPTDDPKKAVAGLILPMSGPKGYGLSMAIDILAGMLSSASYLDGVGRFYSEEGKCMDVGHLFIAIDPSRIYGSDFYSEMDNYFRRVRDSRAIEGKKVFVPGDLNAVCRTNAIHYGIDVRDDVADEISKLLKEQGLELTDFM